MKKLFGAFLGLALAANLLVAEENGWFVGGQLGYANETYKFKSTVPLSSGLADSNDDTWDKSEFDFGVLGGYKHFLTPEFGVRGYGLLKYRPNTFSAININANADAIYNFFKNEKVEVGAFGGLSLGYVYYNESFVPYGILKDERISGFDLALNLGVKTQILEKHGVEIFTRFAFLQSTYETNIDGFNFKWKLNQPYAFGVRYTYSF